MLWSVGGGLVYFLSFSYFFVGVLFMVQSSEVFYLSLFVIFFFLEIVLFLWLLGFEKFSLKNKIIFLIFPILCYLLFFFYFGSLIEISGNSEFCLQLGDSLCLFSLVCGYFLEFFCLTIKKLMK